MMSAGFKTMVINEVNGIFQINRRCPNEGVKHSGGAARAAAGGAGGRCYVNKDRPINLLFTKMHSNP
jgi:hypothetical protein